MPRQQRNIVLSAQNSSSNSKPYFIILIVRETGSFDTPNCDAAVVESFGGERLRMRKEGKLQKRKVRRKRKITKTRDMQTGK